MEGIPMEKKQEAADLAEKVKRFMAQGGKVQVTPQGVTAFSGPKIRDAAKARASGSKQLTRKTKSKRKG